MKPSGCTAAQRVEERGVAHAEEEDKKGDPGAGSGNCAGKDASSSNPMFQAVLEGYRGVGGKAATAVLRRLDAVRLRGRKRTMVG